MSVAALPPTALPNHKRSFSCVSHEYVGERGSASLESDFASAWQESIECARTSVESRSKHAELQAQFAALQAELASKQALVDASRARVDSLKTFFLQWLQRGGLPTLDQVQWQQVGLPAELVYCLSRQRCKTHVRKDQWAQPMRGPAPLTFVPMHLRWDLPKNTTYEWCLDLSVALRAALLAYTTLDVDQRAPTWYIRDSFIGYTQAGIDVNVVVVAKGAQ